MDTTRAGGKRRMNDDVAGEEEEEEDADVAVLGSGEEDKKRRVPGRKSSGAAAVQQPCCQVENCTSDMSGAKPYHRRHKVCQFHAKLPMVVISGVQQRFCQQCSRFHELTEFDDTKKSCRRRLAGHNERRRKSSYENLGEGSGLT